jgi:trans-aconitate methyltransferase
MTNQWDAEQYDDKHAFVYQKAKDLVDLLAPRAGERVLDLGCGTGVLTAEIAGRGAEIFGVDLSEDMIAQAKKKYPKLKFEVSDARALRFDAEFDAVFSNAVLHWIPEAEEVLAGVARALKPGGRFVAEFGGKGNIRKLVEGFRRAFVSLGMREPDNLAPWFYPSVAEYARLLEAQGLELREASLYDRPTMLEDGEQGLENWIRVFRKGFLEMMGGELAARWINEVKRQCRAELFKNGGWELDYRRLRIASVRI